MTSPVADPRPPHRTSSPSRPRRTRPVVQAVFALALSAGLLAGDGDPASGQLRPEIGVSLGAVTGFDGDALEQLESDLGVGLDAGLAVTDAWRFGVSGRWSSHGTGTSSLPAGAELWSAAGEVLWRPTGPQGRVRPHLGVRAGVSGVDYDLSRLAVIEIDLVPGARVVEDDAGLFLAPVAGLRVPLSRRFSVELDGEYGFYDVDPVIVGPESEVEGSRGVAVEMTVVAGL